MYWLKTLSSIFPALSIVLIIRSFIYEPFQIPSGSMMPTLLIGDFILVEKFSYGIKDPVYQKTIIETGHPKRGDVVVFKYTKNPNINYIKRVIGIPGDKIVYDSISKKITIYPDCGSSFSCKKTLKIKYSNSEPSNFLQKLTIDNNNAVISNDFFELSKNNNKENFIRLEKIKETIENESHSVLTLPIVQDQQYMYYQQPGQKIATWILPVGQYFMMGDNRDSSSDSRYWGFVPEKNLVGKAKIILLSFKKQEEKNWPISIRFNHIGKIK